MEFRLNLSAKYNYAKNYNGEKDKYIFERHGGEVFFEVNGKIPPECKYFAFDIENPQDFSARIEIRFYKAKISEPAEWFMENPDFSITTGVLPFIKTTVEIPVSYLDGQRLFGERRKGILKTVVNGKRMNPDDIAYIGVYMAKCHIRPVLGISGARFASEASPPSDFNFDSLIDGFGQWNQKDWKNKTKSIEELKLYLDGELKKAGEFLKDYKDGFYGSGESGYKATGYFRTEKLPENKFIMVAPDGREFFGFGCDCVGLNISGPLENGETINFLEENLRKVWGDLYYENWQVLTKYRLIKWGINTIAAWSDIKFAKQSKIPYVFILNGYPSSENCIYRDFPDVFSDEFKSNSEIYAKALEEFRGDPYLIGYFMSNEPNWAFVWGLNLGYETFISPGHIKSKRELIKFLESEYGGVIDDLNLDFDTDFKDFGDIINAGINTKISERAVKRLDKFSKILIREYIKIPALALKSVDAEHLNLGIRYAFISNDDLFEGREYFDVFSINCYDNYPEKAIERVAQKTNMPVMLGEFHFGALDAGLPATGIRGVESQKDRGKAINEYISGAKNTRQCVGAHYFQLNDQPYLGRFDGENYNIGLVDICCVEYSELTDIISPVERIPEIFF